MLVWGSEGVYLHVVTVSAQVGPSGQVIYSGSGWLLGYTCTETTGGAPATVVLVDGTDANGQQLDQVNLTQGQTDRFNPGQPGTPLARGLWVKASAGTAYCTFTIGVWQ